MNKVLQGLYPPGSTVKPMNGLALLGAGVPASDRVVCTGALRVGNGIFHCHKKSGHGALDLKNAIMQSCDIYFYEMVRRLGYEHVAPVARTLGLGQKFALPFNSQRYGTVPDPAWKLRRYKHPWTVADSLNASIGQGYVLSNPLQLAVMASRLASGRALQPSILAADVRRDAPLLPFEPDHLQTVHEAMWGECWFRAWRSRARPARRRSAASPWPNAPVACSRTARSRSRCATTRCSRASRRTTSRVTQLPWCSNMAATPSAISIRQRSHAIS
jgi:penicillin-binding protein 2